MAHGAASACVGARREARAAPPQLPRLHADSGRPDRRRAVRRRRGDGAARGRRGRRARRCLRRRARAPRRRADAPGPPAGPAGRRGARRRGAADPSLGALRGIRRAHPRPPLLRRNLDRALCPLRRRARGNGCRRRSGAPLAGRDGERGVAACRELLGRARGRPRVSALHPPARVPRLARTRGAAVRAPRADRRMAPRPEPAQERAWSGSLLTRRGGGLGGTERFPLARHRGLATVPQENQ